MEKCTPSLYKLDCFYWPIQSRRYCMKNMYIYIRDTIKFILKIEMDFSGTRRKSV